MNHTYRVSVKTALGGWWIVYEGNDRETAEAIYDIHAGIERTVIEKI